MSVYLTKEQPPEPALTHADVLAQYGQDPAVAPLVPVLENLVAAEAEAAASLEASAAREEDGLKWPECRPKITQEHHTRHQTEAEAVGINTHKMPTEQVDAIGRDLEVGNVALGEEGWDLSFLMDELSPQDKKAREAVEKGYPDHLFWKPDLFDALDDKSFVADAIVDLSNYKIHPSDKYPQTPEVRAVNAVGHLLDHTWDVLRRDHHPAFEEFDPKTVPYDIGKLIQRTIEILTTMEPGQHTGSGDLVQDVFRFNASISSEGLLGLTKHYVQQNGRLYHSLSEDFLKLEEHTGTREGHDEAVLLVANQEFVNRKNSFANRGKDEILATEHLLSGRHLLPEVAKQIALSAATCGSGDFIRLASLVVESSDEKVLDLDVLIAVYDGDTALRARGESVGNTSSALADQMKLFSPEAQRAIKFSQDVVDVVDPIVLKSLRDIWKGELSEETVSLGLSEVGTKGEQQLRELLTTYRQEYLNPDLSNGQLEQMLEDPLRQAVFKSVTRYTVSEWGAGHTEKSFVKAIEVYMSAREANILEPMPDAYAQSEVVEVDELNQKGMVELGEDVLSRYHTLAVELHSVANVYEQTSWNGDTKRVHKKYVDALRDKILEEVASLEEAQLAFTDTTPEPQRQSTAKRIEDLRFLTEQVKEGSSYYRLQHNAYLEKGFDTLSRSKGLHPFMRDVIFSYAFQKNPAWIGRFSSLDHEAEPSTDNLDQVREFVEHVSNQETWARQFTYNGSELPRKLEQIVSVRTISEALAKMNQEAKLADSKMPMQFIPTKGIMHEFSGSISDACWAEKEPLNDERPNMTTVLIKQRPGDALERYAGVGMLIETHNAATNDPVLMIRGLNPLNAVINKLSSESFFNEFTTYARAIAQERGMQLAIAIDGHSGGAASNRPNLWNYMYGRRASMKEISVPNDEVMFNGYGTDPGLHATMRFQVYEV